MIGLFMLVASLSVYNGHRGLEARDTGLRFATQRACEASVRSQEPGIRYRCQWAPEAVRINPWTP